MGEHGWLVKGLEPHGYRRSITKLIHEVRILFDKAPELSQALGDSRPSDHGFSFGDIVTIFAAMERLVLDEMLQFLQLSYDLNNRSLNASLGEKAMQEVLMSFLMTILGGMKNLPNVTNRSLHLQDKKNKSKDNNPSATGWKEMQIFQRDMLHNHIYEYRRTVNPFIPRKLNYKAAQRVAHQIGIRFGKWQDVECRQIKSDLVKMDQHGLGRVPLGMFYRQPSQFTESVEYLKAVGALDESLKKMPMVILANYMTAPCNCIATFKYHTFCCMNECDTLMSDIEALLHASVGSSKQLLSIIANNISSSSVDAPRHLSQMLVDKMEEISEYHQGLIPIHGRLFQQWLHYAFPRECPYPHIAKTAAALTREFYESGYGTGKGKHHATQEDMQSWYSKAAGDSKSLRAPFMSQWTDVEVLPLHDQDTKDIVRNVYSPGIAIHFLVLILSLLCVIMSTCFLLHRGFSPARADHGKGKRGKSKAVPS